MAKAIWILHDQCNVENSAIKTFKKDDVIFMVESKKELDLKFTHKKKTAFILSVNRHFGETLQSIYNQVVVMPLLESEDLSQIQGLLKLTDQHHLSEVVLMLPKSYTHRQEINTIKHLAFTMTDDVNLISDETVMLPWFKSKSFRMETFYQKMRLQTNLLMDAFQQPLGGAFNFDKKNQNKLKVIPIPYKRRSFKKDEITLAAIQQVNQIFPHQLGNTQSFYFAINAKQAQIECDHFIKYILKDFGQYQDNMIQDDAYIAHSLLSAYLNIGLLNPLKVCQQVHHAVLEALVPIESAEGFVRQILGWREYMFYKYHSLMPNLLNISTHKSTRNLPAFYWNSKTKMNCLHQTVVDSLTHAYSHHIQRLMVSANFANLAQIHPFQVHEWFLGIYADAYEWVEVPNTLGMGLFVDQGNIASKPYISSGAYINKMSNYCESCFYDPKIFIGERACPFNALYWNYIHDYKMTLKSNPRMNMIVSSYEKFTDEKKESISTQAQYIFNQLEKGLL